MEQDASVYSGAGASISAPEQRTFFCFLSLATEQQTGSLRQKLLARHSVYMATNGQEAD